MICKVLEKGISFTLRAISTFGEGCYFNLRTHQHPSCMYTISKQFMYEWKVTDHYGLNMEYDIFHLGTQTKNELS